MAIEDTRKLQIKSSELTRDILQEFIEPLPPGTVVKFTRVSGHQLDPEEITLEAKIDISRGRIY